VIQTLKQAWWAPVAGVLALAQLWVALAFFYGEGTSNVLDAESTAAGVSLAIAGAAALAIGLWIRPQTRGLANALVIVGAARGGIWVWTIVMTPMAVVVIVGVVVSQVRSSSDGPFGYVLGRVRRDSQG
jgi:membrane protease YdiL (CAAX protease family)